jgi:hypothetical protein
MTDIFISYAKKDRERVIPIVKALEDQGFSTWWDLSSIPIGKTWRQFIDEGLEAARCVLVIWSKTSVYSEWVLDEADEGKGRKMLVPAIIDDVRPPLGFRQMQAANLVNWNGNTSNPQFKGLQIAIEAIIGPSKPTTASISSEAVLSADPLDVHNQPPPPDPDDHRSALLAPIIDLKAKRDMPALIEALKDKDGGARVYAALGLGNIGTEAKAAVPALAEALNDEDGSVRVYAAQALKKINTSR